eukprot:SAG31_NODE_23973_length_492_cov_0.656489_1_plen_65_part_10
MPSLRHGIATMLCGLCACLQVRKVATAGRRGQLLFPQLAIAASWLTHLSHGCQLGILLAQHKAAL